MCELMLVEEVNGVAVVSSKVIANKIKRDHSSLCKTIKNEICHLEEFGRVGIEFQTLETNGGKQQASVYFLNEEQSTYLLTCLRNNDEVRVFKKNLVKAFSSLKKAVSQNIVANTIGLEKEFSIMSMTADFLRVNDNSRLQMAHKFYESHNLNTALLPDYTDSKGTLLAPTELLKRNNILNDKGKVVSAVAFNKIALSMGIIEERERPSSKGGIKKYKALTEKGLKYGENQVSPQNPKEVQPMYYEGFFMELVKLLGLEE